MSLFNTAAAGSLRQFPICWTNPPIIRSSLSIRKGESCRGQARRDARRAHLHPREQQPARLPGRHARHHGAQHLRHARRTQTRALL